MSLGSHIIHFDPDAIKTILATAARVETGKADHDAVVNFNRKGGAYITLNPPAPSPENQEAKDAKDNPS
jgi:hypothetical protein